MVRGESRPAAQGQSSPTNRNAVQWLDCVGFGASLLATAGLLLVISFAFIEPSARLISITALLTLAALVVEIAAVCGLQ